MVNSPFTQRPGLDGQLPSPTADGVPNAKKPAIGLLLESRYFLTTPGARGSESTNVRRTSVAHEDGLQLHRGTGLALQGRPLGSDRNRLGLVGHVQDHEATKQLLRLDVGTVSDDHSFALAP